MLTVQRCWKKLGKEVGLAALMLSFASATCLAASNAVVSGVVRDAQGVAQMGAMVEVLAAGTVSVATAFTDMYGRYRIQNLIPGNYKVRATASLFVPATRNNLKLATGMRATVNLTLNMLSDPAGWLLAHPRAPEETGDDWAWTLRSSANRPILRMLGDGELVLVSSGGPEPGGQESGGQEPGGQKSGGQEQPSRRPIHARAATVAGNGFGQGGVRNVVALDRGTANGSDLLLRAALATAGGAPMTEVDAGYQQHQALGNASRILVSYVSHPELVSSGDVAGLQLLRMASAERMKLGDAVDVEAGGTVYAIHMAGDALTVQPFLRVTVHPGEVWAVQYRLATSRDLQSFAALDSAASGLPVAAVSGGQLRTESGKHQEISVSRKAGAGTITASVYNDSMDRPVIAGTGVMSSADLAANSLLADTASDAFRLLGTGYTANGVSLAVSEPLTSSLWAALEYATGAGLATGGTGAQSLAKAVQGLHEEAAQQLTAAVSGRVQYSGTEVRAAYRWQPRNVVTAVAPYGDGGDQAYLSFYIRQAVRWGSRLPQGLEATVDVTNLLAEGYRPFLSADGRTLYLAQSPRKVQAGLAFNF